LLRQGTLLITWPGNFVPLANVNAQASLMQGVVPAVAQAGLSGKGAGTATLRGGFAFPKLPCNGLIFNITKQYNSAR
jgi:hypothetical protein